MVKNIDKFEKIMMYSMGIGLSIHRLFVAIGNIFLVISLLCSLYLFYYYYKENLLIKRLNGYKKYYKMWMLMLASFIPALIFSINFKVSLKDILDLWLWRMLPFFIVTILGNDKKRLWKCICMVLVSLSLDSLYAIYQLSYTIRPWGFGGNALNLGTVLGMVIPMVAVVLLDDNFSSRWKKFCFLVFVCLIGGVIANNSRSAWLSLIVVLPLLSLKYIWQSKKILSVFSIGIIGLAVFFSTNSFLMSRLSSITNLKSYATSVRFELWENAIILIKDNPVVGVGFGNYVEAKSHNAKYQKYRFSKDKNHIESNPHNYFLQILADSGIVGFLGYLAFISFIVFDNLRCWLKQKNPYALMIAASCFGTFFIIANFTTVVHKSGEIKIWWFLLGSLLYLRNEFNLAQNKDTPNNED